MIGMKGSRDGLRAAVSAAQFVVTVFAVNHDEMETIAKEIATLGASHVLEALRMQLPAATVLAMIYPATVAVQVNPVALLQAPAGSSCVSHYGCGQDSGLVHASGLGLRETMFCDASRTCNQCFNCVVDSRGTCCKQLYYTL